jgi:signal transduction histidine kinase/ActR/RegA family two-component response regulator
VTDGSSRFAIRPWLAEFRSPVRERAFREQETKASASGVRLGVAVMVVADLVSVWFDWRLFSARSPEHLPHLMLARAVLFVAVLTPAAALRWWPRPTHVAWTLFAGSAVVATAQAVVSYEFHVALHAPDDPFWFGLFAFFALTVFPVPLRWGLANAAVIALAPLLLHIVVLRSSLDVLSQVFTLCVLAAGLGAAFANRMHRGRRHEHALLVRQRRLTTQLRGKVEERSEAAQRLLEDKSELEARLATAQRLEALGRLAGGVAHDLNNLMTPILACSDIVRRELAARNEPLCDMAGEICAAAERSRALVQQLLAFGRRQTLETVPLDLVEFVTRHLRMLERLLGERVEVSVQVNGDQAVVQADAGQLVQVLSNLGANARDAMPDGGVLTVGVRKERVGEDSRDLATGSYGVLTVQDTGTGMDERTREHLFEPFFTTKTGGHSGLGLATVYGIVQQHGGAIRVRSRPGHGTTFAIYLRATEAAPVAPAPRPDVPGPLAGRTETVLLVEDEREVRRLVETLLRGAGFTVLSAADGATALDLSRRHAGQIHLLVSDVVLRGMSGPEVWSAVREERPETRVLFMSGFSHDVLAHDPTDPRVAFLQKPFTLGDIEDKLRLLLGRVAGAEDGRCAAPGLAGRSGGVRHEDG